MNKVRDELQRVHEEHTAAQAEQPQKKKRIRNWFREAILRGTSTKR